MNDQTARWELNGPRGLIMEGNICTPFMRQVWLHFRPDKDIQKNYRSTAFIDTKVLNSTLTNRIQYSIKKVAYLGQVGFMKGIQDCFNSRNSINIICPVNISKEPNHMFIFVGTLKASDEKTLKKTEINEYVI